MNLLASDTLNGHPQIPFPRTRLTKTTGIVGLNVFFLEPDEN
jgi:hypothetical protein